MRFVAVLIQRRIAILLKQRISMFVKKMRILEEASFLEYVKMMGQRLMEVLKQPKFVMVSTVD